LAHTPESGDNDSRFQVGSAGLRLRLSWCQEVDLRHGQPSLSPGPKSEGRWLN
jgi:hypothetical protein